MGGSGSWEETSSGSVTLVKTKAESYQRIYLPSLEIPWSLNVLPEATTSYFSRADLQDVVLAPHPARPLKIAWNCYFSTKVLRLQSPTADVITEGTACST